MYIIASGGAIEPLPSASLVTNDMALAAVMELSMHIHIPIHCLLDNTQDTIELSQRSPHTTPQQQQWSTHTRYSSSDSEHATSPPPVPVCVFRVLSQVKLNNTNTYTSCDSNCEQGNAGGCSSSRKQHDYWQRQWSRWQGPIPHHGG